MVERMPTVAALAGMRDRGRPPRPRE